MKAGRELGDCFLKTIRAMDARSQSDEEKDGDEEEDVAEEEDADEEEVNADAQQGREPDQPAIALPRQHPALVCLFSIHRPKTR